MRYRILITFLLTLFLFPSVSLFAQDGETLFKATCSACHKVSSQRLVGPGLANVDDRRSEEWFDQFVKSSQSFIKSGDPDAIAIFEEYNQIQMPDQALSEAELDAVWAYILENSPETNTALEEEPEEPELPFEPTAEEILKGQHLFTGIQRLENGGPSCITCHTVKKDDVMSGGALAADLSDVFERFGGKDGVSAQISSPPAPEMKISYKKHPVTEEENYQLTAFLKDVSEGRFYQEFTSYRNMLLIWGIIGAFILMGIYPALWYKRKKDSVNKRIYDRQIKSYN